MNRIATLLIVCVAFVACNDKSKFEISGKFEHAKPQAKVYLYGINKTSETPLDSTVLSNKGEFKFNRSTPEVDFFRVKIENSEYMLIAKNGDVIKLEADLEDKNLAYKLSGAAEADKLEELNKNKNQYVAKLAALQAQFEENVANQPHNRDAIANQMRPALIKENEGLVNYILKFAMDNTTSLAGFYAINSLNPSDYEKEMIAYSEKIKSNFNKNEAVTDFLVRMAKLKSVQIGQLAPDFTMNTLDGKTVKLSDLRGKYVLLDFWASWCQPCRQENPNVVKVYNKYKDRKFTILGVSLDKDPVAWKQAVIADGLTWTHASELKDFESPTVRMYQVEAIPSSFILDPSGKIIAKNLRAEELDTFLEKTLR
ncbi:Thioredoxin [Pedobacter cryoconitis]|uniref:Thioredoxin n=1 Tax=Pedobacter cryoconitis TaxID=188932 RepID=A0A127V8H6_9SPHI|nr:TlpA disulfide reductase family protein [Pedobacter cryoconitis]AMP97623.1 Thioredoxin [Pedobacter cryoconitis]